MATIPKTLRGKKRYLLIRLSSSKPLFAPQLSKSFFGLLGDLYGSVGLARQKAKVVEFNLKSNSLIISCALESVSDVMAAVILWNQIDGEALKTRLAFKTGSLKKARQKAK